MSADPPVRFEAGSNIAVKVPAHQYHRVVAFYRDTLGLPELRGEGATAGAIEAASTVFQFGALKLWVDCMEQLSQAEIWLEVRTPDVEAAARHLAGRGVARCDAIEPLPEGFQGFWIAAPGGLVHLVAGDGS